MSAEWERQPDETSKSFAGFNRYLNLLPADRSLVKVAELLGHSSKSTVEKWSREHRWVERVEAHDSYLANSAIEVRKVGISEAQANHISSMTMTYATAQRLGMELLAKMREDFADPDKGIDTRDYSRVVKALIDIDTGVRRTLNLPTQFKTASVDEPDADGDVYFVGG